MNTFQCLENSLDSNDSIFIEDAKDLKKYQKKLRQSKTPQKSKLFQDAIDEYHFYHRKVIKNKNIKTMKTKVVSDDELLDKAIRENNGIEVVIESDKDLKEQRRLQHKKNVNKKKIESKINGVMKRCMRIYLEVWRKMNNDVQCKKNNMVELFKYTQSYLVLENIIKKWKFHSDYMVSRDKMKCRFYEKQRNFYIKFYALQAWHMLASKIQCNICYDDYNKDNIVTTDCGHEFCNDCIDKWKNKCFKEYKDASCPLCRQVFEYRPHDYREPIEQYQETLINDVERGPNGGINQIHFDPNNPEIINREEVNVDMSGGDPVQRRLDFGLHNTFTINNNYITNTYHNNIISISAQDIQDSLIP